MHDKHILNTNAPIQKNISFLPSIADFFILREYKQRRSDTKKIYQKNNIYFKDQQIGTNIHLNLILDLTMHFRDFSQNTWHVILTLFRKKWNWIQKTFLTLLCSFVLSKYFFRAGGIIYAFQMSIELIDQMISAKFECCMYLTEL